MERCRLHLFGLAVILWIYTVSVHNTETGYTIGILLPLSGDQEKIGRSLLPVVQEAIINGRNITRELHGRLDFTILDSRCDMAHAMYLLYDQIAQTRGSLIIVGDVCSSVTKPIAEYLSFTSYWQMSFMMDEPSLNDASIYRNLVQIAPSPLSHHRAIIALLRTYNWNRTALIVQDAAAGNSKYTTVMNHMSSLLHSHHIDLITTESMLDQPDNSLNNIRVKDGRIIIISMDETHLSQMLCQAYKDDMYGYKYVWIILGTYSRYWWRNEYLSHECTSEQILTVLNGHFTIKTAIPTQITNGDDSTSNDIDILQGYAYDSILFAAESFQLMKSQGFDSLDEDTIFSQTFRGRTGSGSFVKRERQGYFSILQMQGEELVPVAEYDMHNPVIKLNMTAVIWKDSDKPPFDSIIRLEQYQPRSPIIQGILIAVTSCGVVLAILVTAVNLKYRKHSYLKMSSPKMNQLIIVGCILAYLGVYLMTIETNDLSNLSKFLICAIRSWVLAIAFSLSFGALFAKTWRVFLIFNSPQQRIVIKDQLLFIVVSVLIVTDIILLAAWTAVDPLQVINRELSVVEQDNELIIIVTPTCRSSKMNVWMSIFYVYKGLLLLIGCLFAWRTRHVSISALNDSKHIGLSVYNVVLMCASAVAISFIKIENPDYSLLIIALLINLSTSVTLAIIFIPKMMAVYRDPVGSRSRPRVILQPANRRSTKTPQPNYDYINEEVTERQAKLSELEDQITELNQKYSVSTQLTLVSIEVNTEESLLTLIESPTRVHLN